MNPELDYTCLTDAELAATLARAHDWQHDCERRYATFEFCDATDEVLSICREQERRAKAALTESMRIAEIVVASSRARCLWRQWAREGGEG